MCSGSSPSAGCCRPSASRSSAPGATRGWSGKAPHPGFKGNFRVFDDARDFVAEVVGFVPDTYKHESVAYGDYSNAVRGRRRKAGSLPGHPEVVLPHLGRVRLDTTWRDLVKRIDEVDPLVCRCGGTLRIVGPRQARDERGAPSILSLSKDDLDQEDVSQVPAWWDQDEPYSQAPPSSEE